MNSGGRKSNPYAGVGHVYSDPVAGANRVLGGNMPGQTIASTGVSSTQVYGNNNYVNQNLQGVSQNGSSNVVNVNQIGNTMSAMTGDKVERMRRESLTGSNGMTNSYAQYQTQFPNNYPTNTPQIGNQPYMTPSDANQMYMAPPSIPQVTDMQPVNSYANAGIQQSSYIQPAQPAQPIMHDINTPEGSIDYLNSIAPASTKAKTRSIPNPLSSKLFMVAGIGMVVLVLIVAIAGALANSGGPSFSSTATALGKDIANLQSIITYGENNAQYNSTDLVGVTAEAHLVMDSHVYQLGQVMTLAIDEDGEATDAIADEEVTAKLEAAKATGNITEAYREELTDNLETVLEAINESYKATKNSEIKSKLETAYKDVYALIQRADSSISETGGKLVDLGE